MTLKYESEILFDLMKRDGDDAPSDVLPYESELKEKYLKQVEGAYPKLQDYRSEWLNYNLMQHQPADFPIVTVSNVTETTVHNVVPYAYKSAILSGSTKYRDIDTGEFLETFEEGRNLELVSVKMPVLKTTGKNLMPINSIVPKRWSGNILNHKICDINLKPNTSYTFSNGFDGASNAIRTRIYDDNNTLLVEVWGNEYRTFKTNTNENYWVLAYNMGDGNIIKDIQIEEGAVKTAYEPYKSNILTVNEDVTLRSNGDVYDELNLLTGRLTQRIDENNEVLAQEVVKTVDLSVIDQDGKTLKQIKPLEGTMHISTDGTPLKPTVSMEIPVEAITQNLNSFNEEE